MTVKLRFTSIIAGSPFEFNPMSLQAGGDMALWNDVKGGTYPWDNHYYQANPDTSTGFDPTFIMQHAADRLLPQVPFQLVLRRHEANWPRISTKRKSRPSLKMP